MKFRGEVHWYKSVEAKDIEEARLKLLELLNDVNFHDRLQVEPSIYQDSEGGSDDPGQL